MASTAFNSLTMVGSDRMIEWAAEPGLIMYDLSKNSVTPMNYADALTRYGLSIAFDPTTLGTGTEYSYVPCGFRAGADMAQVSNNLINPVLMPTTGVMQKIGYYSFGTRNAPYTDVVEHCMVPAMNGAKMIMFGGQRATDYKAISEIHILDTTTMAWKTGTPAPAQEARRSMACTVSGDYFIAWGGTNGTVMGPKPLVYNMKTDQWVDQFLAPGDNGAAASKGTNIGAIAGGAGGAVVLIIIVLGFVFYRRRQQRNAKNSDDNEPKDKSTEREGSKDGKKPGDDLKKDPQGNNISISALAAGTGNNDGSGDGGEMMVEKDGRVAFRNPQSVIHTASGGHRSPQYQSGVYLPTVMYQNNPQYFEPGTQFSDMQYYPTAAANPQLYASSPFPMSARAMNGITGNSGIVGNNLGGSAPAPMTEEILQLQLALVKAQQDQQFQLQQQNLARFRAEQEAQLQMLQQQLRNNSSPSMTNVLSAPVPTVSPLMPGVSALPTSSVSAPVPTVGSEPPSSSPLSAATTAVVDFVTKADAPMMDYVPAPVFASVPPSSSATSAATTLVTSVPVSTVASEPVLTVLPSSNDTLVKPPSAASAPVATPLSPST
ncbi:hypothetical protein BGZ90_001811 [Linnemannia elongata]|nr:hypothetical protein BGZ90_001811 [Linnemannia elongata]